MSEKTKITIERPKIGFMNLLIEGVTELISNRKPENLNFGPSGQGKTTLKEKPLSPEEQYQRALHPVPDQKDKYGFPASGFKKSAVSAATGKGWWEDTTVINGKKFKGSVFVLGDIIPIEGKIKMRTDDGRRPPKTGAPCKIYRAAFDKGWKATLPIRFNASLMNPDEIVAVFDMAGLSIGVGDDRPEKNGGSFGQFKVVKVEGGKDETS